MRKSAVRFRLAPLPCSSGETGKRSRLRPCAPSRLVGSTPTGSTNLGGVAGNPPGCGRSELWVLASRVLGSNPSAPTQLGEASRQMATAPDSKPGERKPCEFDPHPLRHAPWRHLWRCARFVIERQWVRFPPGALSHVGTPARHRPSRISTGSVERNLAVVAQPGSEQLPVEEKVVGSNPIVGAMWP